MIAQRVECARPGCDVAAGVRVFSTQQPEAVARFLAEQPAVRDRFFDVNVNRARMSFSLLVRRLAGERSPEHVLLRPSPVFRDSDIATPLFPVNVGTIQKEEITQP